MLQRVTITLGVLCCIAPALAVPNSSDVWLDVPFVQQPREGCGAASIAMVMQYWQRQQSRPLDESANAERIQQSLHSTKARGIYARDLERYFRAHGFQTFTFRGEWSDLKQHLEKGRPLLVALKPSAGDRSLHYVVIAGLESDQGVVLVNDPAQRKLLKQERSAFLQEWSATGNWTLLALPKAVAR